MKLKILCGILPLVIIGLGIANAEDVKTFRPGDRVDPDEIARMLGGGTSTPQSQSTPAPESSPATDEPAPKPKAHRKHRGLALDTTDAAPTDASTQQAMPQQHAASSSGGAFSLPINFGYNSADILSESLPQLDAVGEGIKKAGVRVVIEGHTDAKGSTSSNQKLSLKRAEAVKHYLVRKYGISGRNLMVEGKGSSELLNASDPYADENRRVQFRAAH